MRQVSSDFAPPLKLIAPFFRVGVWFFVISMVSLLFFDTNFNYEQIDIAGWLHLFMLGFVMMVIFGAMAQLVPVALETGHVAVDLYYAIFPLLLIGTIGMVLGFWINIDLLPFAGLLVLTAMIIFAGETFFTLKKVKEKNLTTKTVKWSNIFLLLGILTGFILALALNGKVALNVDLFLKAHIFMVIGGYVMLTIIGLSLILLPMFSLAHGFSQKDVEIAFKLVLIGVLVVFLGAVIRLSFIMYIGYFVNIVGVIFYLKQVWIIYKLRVRKELDIWLKSMLFAYGSLIFATILAIIYFISSYEKFLIGAIWFLLLGFISFMITGHLYKIVPFLVWFERFAPLVGKKRVPMLHEMFSKESADFMFYFSASGVLIAGIGLIFDSNMLFKGGASFMFVGSLFMLQSMNKMLNFSEDSYYV